MIKFKLLLLFSIIINAVSFSQWTNNTDYNTIINDLSGEQAIPKIATLSDGSSYVGFFSNDASNYDIRLQKIDSEGNLLWDNNGLLISNHTQQSWISDWEITVDNDDNCILVFSDIRDGNPNIFAYKIDPDGSFLWGADGISLSNNTSEEYAPKVIVTDSNNAIVTWDINEGSITKIKLQKITPSGELPWGEDGILFQSGESSYAGAVLVPSDEDNFIATYYHQQGNFPYYDIRHIYSQKFSGDGVTVWDEECLVTNKPGIAGFDNIIAATDNNNGVIITWRDDRDGNNIANSATNHITSEGECLWTESGTEVSNDINYNHLYSSIVGAIGDDVIVMWAKLNGNQTTSQIYIQKFSKTGERLWGDTGVEITKDNDPYSSVIGGATFDDKAYITFQFDDLGSNYQPSIYSHAINSDGSLSWNDKIQMSSRISEKIHTINSSVFENQLVVLWEDDDGSKHDIYAQNIHLDGTLGNISGTYTNNIYTNKGICYPNPANNNIFIEGQESINSVVITNLLGEEVLSVPFYGKKKEAINISSLSNSVYFIVISYENKVTESMLFIKK